jgi:hypothetical protein
MSHPHPPAAAAAPNRSFSLQDAQAVYHLAQEDSHLGRKVTEALDITQEAIDRFGSVLLSPPSRSHSPAHSLSSHRPEHVAFSFNGGKDCESPRPSAIDEGGFWTVSRNRAESSGSGGSRQTVTDAALIISPSQVPSLCTSSPPPSSGHYTPRLFLPFLLPPPALPPPPPPLPPPSRLSLEFLPSTSAVPPPSRKSRRSFPSA